jgi:hypothetical protein
VKVVCKLRSGALVVRAGKATGRNATVTLKSSGMYRPPERHHQRSRVPSARRVSFTVKVASFTAHGVRYRPSTELR